jgi:fatty-acyl-CoA synthase
MIRATDWIAYHADRTPEKLAAVDLATGQRFSYSAFNERAGRLAAFLRDEWGVQAGDRLAILARNSVDYFTFQFACIKLGAVMLPLNWRLAASELVFILNDSGADVLLYDADFKDRVPALVEGSAVVHVLRLDSARTTPDGNLSLEEAIDGRANDATMPVQTTHDSLVGIMYTAGTTGHPKGALITHGMMFWNAVNISVDVGLHSDSVNLVVLPTFHTGGLNLYANPAFHCGATNVVMRDFDPGQALAILSRYDPAITHIFSVPAIYLFMSRHPDFESADLSGVKSWGCGGAPMPVALLKTYAERGIVVQLGFGMTETSPSVFLTDPRRALEKPASVGKGLMHVRVRVVNERFEDVAAGEVGELVISGPHVTPGYWNRPDASDSSFTTDEYGYRWLHSGDAARVDEEGCIFIVDRYKDMYISGGENVYPAEVEQVIMNLPDVADAGVIGVPDARWGEVGLAVVVLKPGCSLSADMIIEHCRQNLARYKAPRHIVFTEELPRNAAGKILKRVLREQYGENPGV